MDRRYRRMAWSLTALISFLVFIVLLSGSFLLFIQYITTGQLPYAIDPPPGVTP
jgi:hypothetical protein